MSRDRHWPPKQHVHKGFARVSWGGSWYHLGRAGSEEARAAYSRLTNIWRTDPYHEPDGAELTVPELCREYLAAAPFPPAQRIQYGRAVHLLAVAHAGVRVDDFGPVLLTAWQRSLASERSSYGNLRYSRTYVGKLVRIVRACWRWGVATERVRVERWQALLAVRGLRADEGRPGRKVAAADDVDYRAILPHLPIGARGLAQLLRHTGARPSELFALKPSDLDLSATVWTYAPVSHKTVARGKERVIHFGPASIAVLREHWPEDGGPFFPNRRCVVYTRNSLLLAFKRAAVKAGVGRILPYQLRHARLTEVRAAVGIEGAAAVGGHSGLKVAEIYTRQRHDLAAKMAAASG
jgi:integrase